MSKDPPINPDVPHQKIEQWSAQYITEQKSIMRGGRKKTRRAEIRAALKKEFPPPLTGKFAYAQWLAWIAYWVIRIWLSL